MYLDISSKFGGNFEGILRNLGEISVGSKGLIIGLGEGYKMVAGGQVKFYKRFLKVSFAEHMLS